MRHRKTRPFPVRLCLAGCAAIGAGLGSHAAALDGPTQPGLPEILVIGTTPVPGLHVDADKVPGSVQSLFSSDLAKNGRANLIGAINEQLGSVNINDASADPFSPDILYRGFEASPVLGTPEGLAVYQNGVRINEAFGDSVNWDLIPDIAIDRVDLLSSSPLFGLNALGGAMSVTMKNGFTYQGLGAALSGGSFNQRAGSADFGFNRGMFGFYAAARSLNQDGWRQFAHDSVKQYYVDLSLHGDGPTIDLAYSRANNQLNSRGPAPVQSLALSTKNVFTGPQGNINNLDFVTLNAAYDFTKTLGVQSVVYFRNYRQTVANGNTSNYTRCADMAALCQSDGTTPLTDLAGATIPDISNGGADVIGQNDFESIHSQSWGGSLQFTSTEKIADHGNTFAAGATIDTARTKFTSGTELGVIDSSLTVLPSPYFVDTPEGTGFSATPVVLNADNNYYGFFATDTFDVTSLLAVTLSGRYNIAKVDLSDQRGTSLNGNNRFTHFNPAVGATYKVTPGITVYAGYSTNNRAPTPSEIECSDPLRPCLLPTSLAGDPPNLKQVIAKSYEVGARGRATLSSPRGSLAWNASIFRTDLDDDIYGVATSVSTGFFQNIGATRRQGFETGINYQDARWLAYGQFSYVDATFQSPLLLYSPSNPFQNAAGDIQVLRGDHLPLIPKTRVKLGADYTLTPNWSIGASVTIVGNSFYKGDESNQNPELPGYTVVALRSSYHITPQVELFANVQNLLDRRYSTLGLYGDPTGVGAPGIPPDAVSNDPRVDNRFQSPAMPRAYFGGIKVKF
ncbi:MAG: iron complex outerrane recepter protein [Gammaproteobacteria bacterium]|nr:iron complex outerrane recepter protein [Gammaproteobacteria bacterium]